ncbi:MAG: hypothetical protein NTY12_01560 [Candidatus Falkowbacteria bacterium]|nr:hypothetical protein [Candidatus Falkowbacteria bacterium]
MPESIENIAQNNIAEESMVEKLLATKERLASDLVDVESKLENTELEMEYKNFYYIKRDNLRNVLVEIDKSIVEFKATEVA